MDFYRPPTNQEAVDALGNIYRALRIWKFYPKGHPTRRSSINHAHSAMLKILNGSDFLLTCSRTGFSFPDGERLADPSRLSNSLAYELFIRRIQKITFLHDLYPEDLLDFLRIIASPPETIQKMGGADKIMSDHGIRSIWANEFDLLAIHGKRSQIESRGITPPALDEAEGNDGISAPFEQQPPQADNMPPQQQLEALLERLAAAGDEDIYCILLRQAIGCADALKSSQEITSLFPMIELLADHSTDERRNRSIRECGRFALEQLAYDNVILQFSFDHPEGSGNVSKKALQALVSAGGPSAIRLAAEQMGSTNNLTARKNLAVLLANLGEVTVPVLLGMIGDKRWYLVRNICSIFGIIANNDAVPGLITCLRHTDLRVCKEAVRSLAKIGGREAESALIGILREKDTELYPQAMASLGSLKSRKSLTELLRILSGKDMFLKSLPLKIDALAAITMIGDRQVAPRLAELLTERHLLAQARWKQLKIAIAQCLGTLGDIRALPALRELAFGSGELGAACNEAIERIERSGGKTDGRT